MRMFFEHENLKTYYEYCDLVFTEQLNKKKLKEQIVNLHYLFCKRATGSPVVLFCSSPMEYYCYYLYLEGVVGRGSVNGYCGFSHKLKSYGLLTEPEGLPRKPLFRNIDFTLASNYGLFSMGEAGYEMPEFFIYYEAVVEDIIRSVKFSSGYYKDKRFNKPLREDTFIRDSSIFSLNKKINFGHYVVSMEDSTYKETCLGGIGNCYDTLAWLLAGEIQLNVTCATFYKDVIIVLPKIRELKYDERHRLHNLEGPAYHFNDLSDGIYKIHGITIPKEVITDPDYITPSVIDQTNNLEIKRILLERYTPERYIQDSNAEVIDSSEWGTLYRKDMHPDDPLVMVKCINSTMEPDGTFKDYFIPVPPYMVTARQALAWTFNIAEDDYYPLIET